MRREIGSWPPWSRNAAWRPAWEFGVVMGKASKKNKQSDLQAHVDYHWGRAVELARQTGGHVPKREDFVYLLTHGYVEVEPGRWIAPAEFER